MKCPKITTREAMRLARRVGLRSYRLREWLKGLRVEQEHADVTKCSPILTARIAAAHLRERGDYYSRLKRYVES